MRVVTIRMLAAYAAFFVISTGIRPLYTSNQNTKFLHGLASAFPDRLGADWTASTVDGLPVFSSLVYLVARFLDPVLFYAIEALLLGVMGWSLVALARLVAPKTRDTVSFLLVGGGAFVLFTSLFSGVLNGVAGQYMTHAYLQPSEFGILFLPALLLAARGNLLALPLAALPAAIHPTYIAMSGILFAVIAVHRWPDRSPAGWLAGMISLAPLLLPAVDLAIQFAPTDAATFARASEILAFERIPHHSDPRQWLDLWVCLRLLAVLAAILVAPRGVVRSALGAYCLYAVGGTVYVLATDNPEVALLAPWRASVIMMPVAVALLTGAAVERILTTPPSRLRKAAMATPVAGAVLVGAVKLVDDLRVYAGNRPLAAHIAFVRANHEPSDIYLTSPGYAGFRLAAMSAQFVTWKTHPYLDTEVIEWKRRNDMAEAVFGERGGDSPLVGKLDCDALRDLVAAYPVTHVLFRLPDDGPPAGCGFLAPVFSAPDGTIMRVER